MNLLKSSILIVDDSLTVLTYCEDLLRNMGLGTVLTASNGTDAIAIVDKYEPDLMLVDVHMSPMDGVELVKILQARSESPKVIFMSSDQSSATLSRLLRISPYGFTTKPPQLEDLLSKIELALLVSKLYAPYPNPDRRRSGTRTRKLP